MNHPHPPVAVASLSVVHFAERLAQALEVQVHCQSTHAIELPSSSLDSPLDRSTDALLANALAEPRRAVSLASEQAIQTAIAVSNSPKESFVLWWSSPNWPLAQLSAKHAQALLELQQQEAEHGALQTQAESLREENQSLFTEVQSLVHQVANDFEEISLIRSLATNLELSSETQSRQQIAQRTLEKLAEGVAARSIAIVFSDSEQQMGTPWWTGQPLLRETQLHALIQQFGAQATGVPVVKNDCQSSPDCDVAGIREFILLECRSRERLQAWVLVCDCTELETVAWSQAGFTTEEASLAETVVGQLAAQFHNLDLLRQKEALFTDVIRALVNAVEARDPYTCGHSERVARFARHLAHLCGRSSAQCEQIFLTGLLHDVGKIAIPDGVLQKPSQLDEGERKIIETHTEAGWRILHELDALSEVLPGVLYHHERFDGKGYPDGLAGAEIPLDGRILAVCDAFDAMTSNRPYRDGMAVQKAAEILHGGSGTHWDPELITLFTEAMPQFDQIRRQYQSRQVPQREKRSSLNSP